jgi:hypothetical protein
LPARAAMKPSRTLATALLLCVAGCASPVAIERPEHALEVELRDFRRHQEVFRAQTIAPQDFDFPGHGRVTVRDISLDGYPGNTYVRCRFHYQNRTDKPVVQSWVSLEVLDAQGNLVASQASVCIVPHPIPIARGSFFADELRTQTHGAHLQPGWSWRIRCTSQLEQAEEPLDPPVAEPEPPRSSAPLEIKDRSRRVN